MLDGLRVHSAHLEWKYAWKLCFKTSQLKATRWYYCIFKRPKHIACCLSCILNKAVYWVFFSKFNPGWWNGWHLYSILSRLTNQSGNRHPGNLAPRGDWPQMEAAIELLILFSLKFVCHSFTIFFKYTTWLLFKQNWAKKSKSKKPNFAYLF